MGEAMTAVKTADRIPVADMERIIAAALDGLDLSHDTEWIRPPSCPCHALGQGCESAQAVRCGCDTRRLDPADREAICGGQRTAACVSKLASVPGAFKCLGHTAEVPTPTGHTVTAGILVSALPACGEDGTVDTREAALSVLSVIEERLGGTYILRAHRLVKRLTEESELYEEAHGHGGAVPDPSPVTAVSVLKCAWCSAPIPVSRGPAARFCKNSHRISAHRAKKREAERANAGASPGR